MTESSTNGLGKGQVNWAYQHDKPTSDSDSDTDCHGDDSITEVPHHSDEEKGRACGSDTHSIILDISTSSFVDTVTVKTLNNVCVCQDRCVLTLLLQSSVLNKRTSDERGHACSSTFLKELIKTKTSKSNLSSPPPDIQGLWRDWFGHLSSRLPRWVVHQTKQRQS